MRVEWLRFLLAFYGWNKARKFELEIRSWDLDWKCLGSCFAYLFSWKMEC